MSEEEKKAYDILLMLKYFTQEKEDKQAIITILELVDKQQKEIEEKTTIIMVGAEKVKGLEKEIEELKFKNRIRILGKYGDVSLEELIKDKFISKDKIKEIINKYVDIEEQLNYSSNELFGEELTNMIIELLEE